MNIMKKHPNQILHTRIDGFYKDTSKIDEKTRMVDKSIVPSVFELDYPSLQTIDNYLLMAGGFSSMRAKNSAKGYC